MPYKLSTDKKCVLVQKDGKWVVHTCYKGGDAEAKARRLLIALQLNVISQEAQRSTG